MMLDRRTRMMALLVGLLLVLAAPAVLAEEGEQEDEGNDDGLVRLTVELRSKEDNEPIENASIYVKFKEERFLWKDKKLEWSLKTKEKGRVSFPPIPEGRVLVQVVAEGWKPFGKYYKVKGPQHRIEIKLEKPKKWY